MGLDMQNGPKAKYVERSWGRLELLYIINKKNWNWLGELTKEGMK